MRFFPHIQIFSRLYNLPPRQAFWSSRRPDSLAITLFILVSNTEESGESTLIGFEFRVRVKTVTLRVTSGVKTTAG